MGDSAESRSPAQMAQVSQSPALSSKAVVAGIWPYDA